MDTLQMTYVFALVAVLTLATVGVGTLIGIIARADAHRVPVRIDDTDATFADVKFADVEFDAVR
ncbi:hypothetical protein [Gordonia insulae]|nr:hypothetical protein [Gordonia insulae]